MLIQRTLHNTVTKRHGERTWIDTLLKAKQCNKYINRYSTLLFMREMQTKTTIRYHLTPTRKAITKTKGKGKHEKWKIKYWLLKNCNHQILLMAK